MALHSLKSLPMSAWLHEISRVTRNFLISPSKKTIIKGEVLSDNYLTAMIRRLTTKHESSAPFSHV